MKSKMILLFLMFYVIGKNYNYNLNQFRTHFSLIIMKVNALLNDSPFGNKKRRMDAHINR